MIEVGDIRLDLVSDGAFRLDGGSMFGIVPKTVWERVAPADENNNIRLALTCLLIRTAEATILVDTGFGRKHEQMAQEYLLEGLPALPESLQTVGVSPEAVTHLVLSHLHLDHAGGATECEGKRIIPAFPEAKVILQEGMLEEALDRNPRTRGSYREEDFIPLEEAGLVVQVKGETELVPGVHLVPTAGHVRHHQCVRVTSGGETAFYWADLMPTSFHVRPAWSMGYDLDPAGIATVRQGLTARALDEKWINIFEHDPVVGAGRFRRDGKKVLVDPIEGAGV